MTNDTQPERWQIERNGRDLIIKSGAKTVAKVRIMLSERESHRKAILIAAAPELLRALEQIAPMIGLVLGRLRYSTEDDAEILPIIRAAIAKATGQ